MDLLRFKDKIYTTQDLKKVLRNIGLKEGDTLLVHTESIRCRIAVV